jgi:HEAT repeat protein
MKKLSGNLHQDLEKLVKTASDDVKTASALALGRIAISNINFYLPFVIEGVKIKSQEYYFVLTLNEIIVSSVSHDRLKVLDPFVEELWNLLINMAADITEEGTRSLVSDCLGKLLLTNPKAYLPRLQTFATSKSETVRATAVTAFRYTLSQTFEEYDNLLMAGLPSFLKLLEDPAVVVRKMALSALNSCLHSKPHLLISILPETTAMLYKETVFKPELVVIVQMGPFQHKVDNGLDNRKVSIILI